MTEPTRADLRVERDSNHASDFDCPHVTITDAEFDAVARKEGYVRVDVLRAFLLDAKSRLGKFLDVLGGGQDA